MKKVDLKNDKTEFLKRLKEIGRPGVEKIANYLVKSDFFTAPASSRHHMAEPGGLCRHSLNVADALKELLFTEGTLWYTYAKEHNITEETCEVVGLLHDICKSKFYVEGYKNQKNYNEDDIARAKKNGELIKSDAKGEFFWETVTTYEIDDQFPMGHGEKSLIMAIQFMKLSKEEQLAIRWHMGFSVPKEEWSALNKAMDDCPLVLAAHLADITATHLMECEELGYEAADVSENDDTEETVEVEEELKEVEKPKKAAKKAEKPAKKTAKKEAASKKIEIETASLSELGQLLDFDEFEAS